MQLLVALLLRQQLWLVQADRALQGAAGQAALARAAATSVASILLADPGQQPNSGVVLSLAPLLGADVEADRSHPRWLHVHVRPPVRSLLKLLKVCIPHSLIVRVLGCQCLCLHTLFPNSCV